MSACPVCENPLATIATVFYPREEESSNPDASVIVNCPVCGSMIDEEIQQAIDALPSIPLVDVEEEEVCPI